MVTKLSVRLVGALVVMIVTSLAVLQVPWVQSRIARSLAAALSEPGALEVRIKGMGGFLPFSIRVDELTCADSEGRWLTVSALRLDTIPSELWRGRIVLSLARAETLKLARFPLDDDTDEPKHMPAFLRALLVGELEVLDLRVGSGLLSPLRVDGDATDWDQVSWSPSAQVRAHGRYYFHSRSLNGEINLALGEIDGRLLGLALGLDEATVSAARLDVGVGGTLRRPRIRARLALDTLRLPVVSAEGIDAVLEAEPEPSEGVSSLGLTLTVETRGVIGSDEGWRGLLGDAPRLEARAVFEPRADRLVLHSARLSTGAAALAVHGRVENRHDLVLQAEAELTDLSVLGGLVSQQIEGRGELRASVEADLSSGVVNADATVALRDVYARAPILRALLGDRARAVGRVVRTATGELSIEGVELAAVGGEASGRARFNPDGQMVSAVVVAKIGDVSELAAAAGSDATGDLAVTATLEGPRDDLDIDVAVVTKALAIADSAAVSGRVGISAHRSLEAVVGDVSGLLFGGSTQASGHADFRWASEPGLELSNMRVDASGAHMSGALSVSLRDRLVAGELHASVPDLSLLAPVARFALAGSATLDAVLGVVDGRQMIDVSVVGEDIVAEPQTGTRVELARAQCDLRVSDALGEPVSRLNIQTSGGRLGDVSIDRASLEVSQGDRVWKVTGEVTGEYFDPFEIATSCLYESTDGGWRVVVEGLDGSVANARVALESATTITSDTDRVAIEGLDLAVAGGRISGDWDELSQPRPQGLIRIANIPLDIIRYFQPTLDVRGRVSGELKAQDRESSSSADVALASLWLDATELEVFRSQRGEATPLEARLELERYDTRLVARVKVDTGVGEGMALRASVPLLDVAGAHSIVVDRHGEIAARVEGQAELAGLLVLGEDAVSGELSVDLALSGTLDDPRLHGSTRVAAGRYASAVTGVAYRDIDLSASADGLRLRLDSLSASDGRKGRLRASGDLDLSADLSSPHYRLAVELNEVRIAKLDELEVRAGGALEMVGGGGVPKVSGRLDLAKAEVALPERLPPEIVTLEVVETNQLYKRSSRLGGSETSSPMPIELDVRVVADGRVFIRSRDFDSEWKGDVVVGGTTASPVLTGGLTLIRGDLDALGIRLKATRGRVGFSASDKIDPSVDVVAESSGNGITGRVVVSGRASNPVFSLESDPPLPPDEIASRLLFGDSPGQLSPAQSLQLAQALARLSGRGGADPLGWIRRTAGLDLLQINSGEEGADTSVVSLGKYIKRGVFVSINQGFASQSSTAHVAVDVTERIKVESEIGTNSTGSIGVTWGWDY